MLVSVLDRSGYERVNVADMKKSNAAYLTWQTNVRGPNQSVVGVAAKLRRCEPVAFADRFSTPPLVLGFFLMIVLLARSHGAQQTTD